MNLFRLLNALIKFAALLMAALVIIALILMPIARGQSEGDWHLLTWESTQFNEHYVSPGADKVLMSDGSGNPVFTAKSYFLSRSNHTGTQAWSTITSTPTTLSGYGITDAQPLDSDLTSISSLTTTSYGRSVLTQADAAALRALAGLGTMATATASDYLTTAGAASGYQPLDSDLTSIAALTTTSSGRSLLTASALTTSGLGLTNGAALDTIAGNGSAYYLDLGNHTGTLPAATLPAPGTSALGGVKRNAGTSGQYVSGIDASGSLVYGTPAGSGGMTGFTLGAEAVTDGETITNLSGMGTWSGTGAVTANLSNGSTPAFKADNSNPATDDVDEEDGIDTESNVSSIRIEADYWNGSASAARYWDISIKAYGGGTTEMNIGPSYLPKVFQIYSSSNVVTCGFSNLTNRVDVNIGDLYTEGGIYTTAMSFHPGDGILRVGTDHLRLHTNLGGNHEVLVSGAGVFGYSGGGGSVTQSTSRTTTVTFNYPHGTITTHNASLAAGAEAEFTVNSTRVSVGDTVLVSVRSGNTASTVAYVSGVSAGSFKLLLSNLHASTAETGAIILNVAVFTVR